MLRRILVFLLTACLLPAACQRDSELVLREQLSEWFFLGETAYFESRTRCTGAMFFLHDDRPKLTLPVQSNTIRTKEALQSDGIAAIRMDGFTPAEMTDEMLLSDTGVFGKEVLAAGALAVPCFGDSEFGDMLHEALTLPGATLAYDRETEGLMILDPIQRRLFFVAGDVW